MWFKMGEKLREEEKERATLTEVLWMAVPQTRTPSRERGDENARENEKRKRETN